MAGPMGYRSYRGRTPKWKAVLAAVLVLVILAAIAVIVLQQHVVYDETGTPHLPLLWQGRQEPEDLGEVDVTIQAPEPEQESPIQALQLADRPLKDWEEAKARLTASGTGYHAVVLTMKDSDGHLYYDSAAGRAISGSIVKTDSTVQTALTAMHKEEDLYTVARIGCLLDPVAARADVEGMGLKNAGGYIFYDGNNASWLDPAKEGTVNYLCAVAVECAEMGFDEILLADLSYPTEGKLDKIDYGGAAQQAALQSLVTAVTDALAQGHPEVRLSVELPAGVIETGRDADAGLVLTDIAPQVDRIYAVTTEDRIGELTAAVATVNGSAVFVPELEADGTTAGESYLLLN